MIGALAAPDYVAAEEPLRLEVRGYKNEFFGLGDVDDDTNSGWGNTVGFNDGEVHFKGSTQLDNGIEVGVDVQLEAFESGDQVDEAYTWLSGDFGKVVIGSENLPDYLTFWGVTAPGVGIPINSGWITVFTPVPADHGADFRRPGLTTNITLTNDTFQIGYQSPRFSGFQFVAGYAPTDASSGNPKNAVTDTDAEVHDIISVGANFSESFNGVDVGVAVGYERGTAGDDADALGADDPQLFKVGASLGFGGFSIAGSYGNMFDGRQSVVTSGGDAVAFPITDTDLDGEADLTATTTALGGSNEGQAYDVGVSYSTGPWGVSVTYFHGEEESSTADPDDDEVDAIVGAVSYAVGPGITASGSVYYANFENEDGVESESTMGIVGIAISF